MSDRPDMSMISRFERASMKKVETKEKNTLPTKDVIDEEKKSQSSD